MVMAADPAALRFYAERDVAEALRGLADVDVFAVLARALVGQVVMRAPPERRGEVLALAHEVARERLVELEAGR